MTPPPPPPPLAPLDCAPGVSATALAAPPPPLLLLPQPPPPPPSLRAASLSMRSSMSSTAWLMLTGGPTIVTSRSAPACTGSAMVTRHADSSRIALMLAPPLPMIVPARLLGSHMRIVILSEVGTAEALAEESATAARPRRDIEWSARQSDGVRSRLRLQAAETRRQAMALHH